jgi:DnaK suppressor protein
VSETKKHPTYDKKTLDSIRKKLIERKKELEEGLEELYQDKGTVGQQGQDLGDLVQSMSLETLKTSLQDTEIAEYNRIRQALAMLEEGTYGICIDCGELISEKRLKLFPNSTRCLVCQEIFEDREHAG